jgi:hypothetical protein
MFENFLNAVVKFERVQTELPAGRNSEGNTGSAADELNTLKASANFSPGLGFDNPGSTYLISSRSNSEGVALDVSSPQIGATLSGLRQSPEAFSNPEFQSKPWAEISQRFQRTSLLEAEECCYPRCTWRTPSPLRLGDHPR